MNRLPHLSKKDQQAIVEFRQRVHEALGDNVKQIKLFGSKARGEARKWSDIDLMVRVKHDARHLKHQVIDIASDVGLKYDVYISPRVIDDAIFKHPVWRATPFIQTVQREGVLV